MADIWTLNKYKEYTHNYIILIQHCYVIGMMLIFFE